MRETKTPNILTIDQILNAQDCPTAIVECPEWGGAVKVRALTLKERSEIMSGSKTGGFGQGTYSADEIERFTLLTFLKGVVEPRFDTKLHFEKLKEKNPAPIDRITAKIWELSGGMQGAREAAKNGSGATSSEGIS